MENDGKNLSPGAAQLKRLREMHRFMLISLVLFFAGVLLLNFLNGEPLYPDETFGKMLVYAEMAFTFIGLPASEWIYRKRKRTIDRNTPLTRKLILYASPFLLRIAILEVPAMGSIIFFLMTGRVIFTGFFLFLTVVMIFTYPGETTLIRDLELQGSQLRELEEILKELRR